MRVLPILHPATFSPRFEVTGAILPCAGNLTHVKARYEETN